MTASMGGVSCCRPSHHALGGPQPADSRARETGAGEEGKVKDRAEDGGRWGGSVETCVGGGRGGRQAGGVESPSSRHDFTATETCSCASSTTATVRTRTKQTPERFPWERGRNGCHAAGLKQEVATALRTLRDKLLAEQRESEHLSGSSSCVSERKHLERLELQELSVQQLSSLRASLQQEVHALSSELVTHLLVRDQLRTKQDAMLLDVQDLT
ncbi:uncharacterized protein LOC121952683 [Plectropomus leopardus]|uniref:uncharacterized protein LOC121952683 n=1 Tax=Plectropomus leopardus TaxID=160734 RepID=UPI001C4D03CE|nr:uncharacterized protein LOC121952683 [Plectropomus leopardus]